MTKGKERREERRGEEEGRERGRDGKKRKKQGRRVKRKRYSGDDTVRPRERPRRARDEERGLVR